MKLTKFAKVENSFLKYATGLLLLVIPLYPKFPLIFVPDTFVAIRLEDFLIAAVLLGWLLIMLHRRVRLWADPMMQLVGIFLFATFLSSLSAILVTKTVVPHIALLHAARRIEYMMVLFLAASAVINRETLRFFVKVVIVAAFVSAVYGVGQKFLALPVISTMNSEFAQGMALSLGPEARVNATFAGHYDLAAYLVPVLVITLAMIFVYRKWREKVIIFLVFFILVWLMLASASRISFGAYLLVAVGLLALVKKKKWIIPVVFVSLAMAAFSQSLTSRYARLVNVAIINTYNRLLAMRVITPKVDTQVQILPSPIPLAQTGEGAVVLRPGGIKTSPRPRKPRPSPTYIAPPIIEDRSMAIRLNVEWPRAIKSLVKNPLVGTGPSSITLATDNDYLRALGETGLVGFISLLTVFVAIFVRTKNLLRYSVETLEGAFGWAMLAGSFGLFINAIFIDVLEASKVAVTLWLLMGIWLGAARLDLSASKKNE